MANQTTVRPVQRGDGVIRPVYMPASLKIFAGAMVSRTVSTGLAVKAGDTSGTKFAGVADKTCDNSAGAASAKKVRVIARGVVLLNCTGADRTWEGQKAYVVDDQTVALIATTTNDILVGTITEVVSATQVFVALTPDA